MSFHISVLARSASEAEVLASIRSGRRVNVRTQRVVMAGGGVTAHSRV